MSGYPVYFPDLSFYQRTVACQFACPVRTDGRAYVTAISRGEYEQAYLIARETNPFASTCGWVCGAPCEAACRRGKIDAPIAIRALKRFTTEQCGAETKKDKPLSVVESVRLITSANTARDELYHIVNAQSEGKLPP